MKNVTTSLFCWNSDIFRILYVHIFFEVQNSLSHAFSVSAAFISVVEFSQARCFMTFFRFFCGWGETESSPYVGHKPRMIDDECRAVGGMRYGKGNRSTPRKPTPVPLSLPQIPHYMTGREPGPPRRITF
jgi:hypothetical protein